MVCSFALNLMAYAKGVSDSLQFGMVPRPIDVANFLWFEVWLLFIQKQGHFPLAPYIQRVIDAFVAQPIQKPVIHGEWIPKKGSYLDLCGPSPSPPAAGSVGSTSAAPPQRTPMAEPFRTIAHFLGKSQKAIFSL